MKNRRKLLVKILTILTLIFGTVSLFNTNMTILETSAKLFVIHDNVAFYNEQAHKTNEMTEEYQKDIEKRNEIYNSDDFVERVFSNQCFIIKFGLFIWAISSFALIPYMWGCNILICVNQFYRTVARQKKNE